jgi:FAD/FMN-containing dehydrogenase
MAAATRCELFDELTDDVIGIALGANGLVAGVEFRHWGGAPARPGADAGPGGHRQVPFSVAIGAMSPDPAQGEAIKAAVDKAAERLAPHATGGTWLNFLTDPARTPDAYTPEDYARLRAVKREYDPDNFFHSNLNIPPAG